MHLMYPEALIEPTALTPASLPVAVIGAGPIGMAAAAQLLERGLEVELWEAGETAARSVASWGHIRLFSPWRHLVDPAARRLLERGGWREPDSDSLPLAAELVRDYLAPLAAALAPRIRTGSEVIAVSREGLDRTRSFGRAEAAFVLRVRTADGTLSDHRARAVIDASGSYLTPNPLAANGLEPLGAGMPVLPPLPDVLGGDRAVFAGRRTLVVGAGHSAANTLLAFAELAETEPGTSVAWAIRGAEPARVYGSDEDELPGRASLGARVRALVEGGAVELVPSFSIVEVGERVVVGETPSGLRPVEADVVVAATGFRPRLDMLRELRLDLDEVVEAPRRLAPLIDPNLHSCGTVPAHGAAELAHPEPGFYLAGMKSYGRAPTFLLATGYEQVRSIAAELVGDLASARAVELDLPATGVCSTALVPAGAAGGCCS